MIDINRSVRTAPPSISSIRWRVVKALTVCTISVEVLLPFSESKTPPSTLYGTYEVITEEGQFFENNSFLYIRTDNLIIRELENGNTLIDSVYFNEHRRQIRIDSILFQSNRAESDTLILKWKEGEKTKILKAIKLPWKEMNIFKDECNLTLDTYH